MNIAALALLLCAPLSAEMPMPTLTSHPAFQMTEEAKRNLVEKAHSLKLGDSYSAVLDKLGKPTYDQPMARKEDDHPIGRVLKYYAVVWEAGLVNELHDQLVAIYLDEKENVREVSIRIQLDR